MKRIAIGNTGLTVNKNGFGALPIQRVSMKEAVYLLQKAYDNGVDFYDTARFYTDSEEKIGTLVALAWAIHSLMSTSASGLRARFQIS